MEKKRNISMAVVKRLPKYHRYLEELIKNGVDRISSKELSKKMGFTASKVRQDLNNFGDFGYQGYGYNVKELSKQIKEILGLTRKYKMVIIGAGNIGQAVANYSRFDKLGLNIVGIFDVNPKLISIRIRDIEIQDIDQLKLCIEKHAVDIGVICVDRAIAQKVCNMLVENGVKGIWNFAACDLKTPEDVIVENVHLSESLLTLTYLLNE